MKENTPIRRKRYGPRDFVIIMQAKDKRHVAKTSNLFVFILIFAFIKKNKDIIIYSPKLIPDPIEWAKTDFALNPRPSSFS